jgi:hypothetical protein
MSRISILLLGVALPIAFAAPLIAQEGKTSAVVVNGNTTTEFKAADSRDIDTRKLKLWNDFASQHPKVAKQLAYKPALINDEVYANKHPALTAFFTEHPDVREAMVANPGNYVAIPPRPGE